MYRKVSKEEVRQRLHPLQVRKYNNGRCSKLHLMKSYQPKPGNLTLCGHQFKFEESDIFSNKNDLAMSSVAGCKNCKKSLSKTIRQEIDKKIISGQYHEKRIKFIQNEIDIFDSLLDEIKF